MNKIRHIRIGELIRHELSQIFLREMEFEPGVIVTITGVEVDKDLSVAKVKLGIYPREKSLGAFKAIQDNSRRLRFLLHRKIEIKPMPSLKFEINEEKF